MAMERTIYREIKATPAVWGLALMLAAFIGGALLSVLYVEHHGHIATGMTNQVVWGLPHVFAIFLIVAASGALNAASIASVFGQAPYKPIARLSAVLAMALLIGGLAVLVLDLGRPDRAATARVAAVSRQLERTRRRSPSSPGGRCGALCQHVARGA